jgi:hypothetical protein
MHEGDFDAVRQVHAEAFGAYWRQQGDETATPPTPHTRECAGQLGEGSRRVLRGP